VLSSAAVGGERLRIVAGVADARGWSTSSTGEVVWIELRLMARRRHRSERTMMPP
jgi:hypothetical protein